VITVGLAPKGRHLETRKSIFGRAWFYPFPWFNFYEHEIGSETNKGVTLYFLIFYAGFSSH
jgi:hypothetical protein